MDSFGKIALFRRKWAKFAIGNNKKSLIKPESAIGGLPAVFVNEKRCGYNGILGWAQSCTL